MRSFVSTCRRVASSARKVVQARRGERDHLDVKSGLVHRRDPTLTDLTQPLPHLPRRYAGPRVLARSGVEPVPRRDDLVGDEVLLSADRLHLGFFLPVGTGLLFCLPAGG